MKKRFVSFFLAFVLSFIATMPAFAADDQNDYSLLSDEELAYCDLATAPAEWRDAILSARREIIYSCSWSAEGTVTIYNPDGTQEILPRFSDLFPDWEVPEERVNGLTNISTHSDRIEFNGEIHIPTATAALAGCFYTFTSNRELVFMRAYGFSGTYNAGFTNLMTGRNAFAVTGLRSGQTISYHPDITGISYGTRVSTDGSAKDGFAEVWQ